MNRYPLNAIVLLLFVFLLTFLSGCIDLDIGIILNKNGSGKAQISITATDPIYNEFVDGMIEDVLVVDPQAKIIESYSNNIKNAEIKMSFQDISELSAQGLDIQHNQRDRKHYVKIVARYTNPVSITLNMPGKIIQSNGNFSGSIVTWDEAYLGQEYWVESEDGIAEVTKIAFFIILILMGSIAIWYFMRRNRNFTRTVTDRGGYIRFCSNCGSPLSLEDAFCCQCGARRD